MCVLSIKVPIQKKSGNLFNDPLIKEIQTKIYNFRYFFSLVWFYGKTTIVDYLMPNPFLYI